MQHACLDLWADSRDVTLDFSAWQADRQCLHRGVQRSAADGVPECALVPDV